MLMRMLLAGRTARMLVAISLLSMLVACGKAASSPSSATTSQNRTKPAISSTVSLELKAIDFNVANLHIYAPNPIFCIDYSSLNDQQPTYLKANLVLATDRLTYDSSELQRMRAYTDSVL